MPHQNISTSAFCGGVLALVVALNPIGVAQAADTSPASLLAQWQSAAGGAASAERGKTFFTSRHGAEWSCASCHGNPPTGEGRHASTGKPIKPLAPSFNPERFTDAAKVEKWIRRNCRDVLARECSASEKADVLAWLIGLK